jgi:hypothetical protein
VDKPVGNLLGSDEQSIPQATRASKCWPLRRESV